MSYAAAIIGADGRSSPDLVFIPPSGVVELDRLAALAHEFDSIEPGATYPAGEFVTWIRREVYHRREVDAEQRNRAVSGGT